MLVPLFRVGTWHGRISLRIVIAGGGEEARATLEHLSRLHGQGVRVLGLFDDRDGARSPQMQMGVPRLGRMADLPDFIARQSVDMVIVTMPPAGRRPYRANSCPALGAAGRYSAGAA